MHKLTLSAIRMPLILLALSLSLAALPAHPQGFDPKSAFLKACDSALLRATGRYERHLGSDGQPLPVRWPDLQSLPIVNLPTLPRLSREQMDPQVIQRAETTIFRIIGAFEGLHGGQRLIIQTRGVWSDFRSSFSATDRNAGDIIPDLRLFPYLLGPKVAFFFGYQIVDESAITVPTPEELIGAMTTLNLLAKEYQAVPIPMGLMAVDRVLETDESFFRLFTEHFSKPISRRGRSFYHDSQGHAMEGFFLPSRVLQAFHAKAMILSRFSNQHGDQFKLRVRSDLIKHIGINLDRLGGALPAFYPGDLSWHFRSTAAKVLYLQRIHALRGNFPYSDFVAAVKQIWLGSSGLIRRAAFGKEERFMTDVSGFYETFIRRSLRDSTIWDEFLSRDQREHPEAYVDLTPYYESYEELCRITTAMPGIDSLGHHLDKLKGNLFAQDFVSRFRAVERWMDSKTFQ